METDKSVGVQSRHILFEPDSMEDIFTAIKSNSRVKYTCFHVSEHYLALGATSGGVYLFKRVNLSFLRTVTSKEGVITQVALAPDDSVIGFSTSRGHVIAFEHNAEKAPNQQQRLQVSYEHKGNQITCLQWNSASSRLFSGDDQGRVSVMNVSTSKAKNLFQISSSILLRLETRIVQLDMAHEYLLVSDFTRCYVCHTIREQYSQIGKKLREGEYGACFYPNTKPQDPPIIFAARPGSRLWEVDIKGQVQNTHQFKQALTMLPMPLVTFRKEYVPPSSDMHCRPQSVAFVKLHTIWTEDGLPLLFTWSDRGVYIIDPRLAEVTLWNNEITGIKDTHCHKNDIYIYFCDGSFARYSLLKIEKAFSQLYEKQLSIQFAQLLLNYYQYCSIINLCLHVPVSMVTSVMKKLGDSGRSNVVSGLSVVASQMEEVQIEKKKDSGDFPTESPEMQRLKSGIYVVRPPPKREHLVSGIPTRCHSSSPVHHPHARSPNLHFSAVSRSTNNTPMRVHDSNMLGKKKSVTGDFARGTPVTVSNSKHFETVDTASKIPRQIVNYRPSPSNSSITSNERSSDSIAIKFENKDVQNEKSEVKHLDPIKPKNLAIDRYQENGNISRNLSSSSILSFLVKDKLSVVDTKANKVCAAHTDHVVDSTLIASNDENLKQKSSSEYNDLKSPYEGFQSQKQESVPDIITRFEIQPEISKSLSSNVLSLNGDTLSDKLNTSITDQPFKLNARDKLSETHLEKEHNSKKICVVDEESSRIVKNIDNENVLSPDLQKENRLKFLDLNNISPINLGSDQLKSNFEKDIFMDSVSADLNGNITLNISKRSVEKSLEHSEKSQLKEGEICVLRDKLKSDANLSIASKSDDQHLSYDTQPLYDCNEIKKFSCLYSKHISEHKLGNLGETIPQSTILPKSDLEGPGDIHLLQTVHTFEGDRSLCSSSDFTENGSDSVESTISDEIKKLCEQPETTFAISPDLDGSYSSLYDTYNEVIDFERPYRYLNMAMYGGGMILPPGLDLSIITGSDVVDSGVLELTKLRDSISSKLTSGKKVLLQNLKDLETKFKQMNSEPTPELLDVRVNKGKTNSEHPHFVPMGTRLDKSLLYSTTNDVSSSKLETERRMEDNFWSFLPQVSIQPLLKATENTSLQLQDPKILFDEKSRSLVLEKWVSVLHQTQVQVFFLVYALKQACGKQAHQKTVGDDTDDTSFVTYTPAKDAVSSVTLGFDDNSHLNHENIPNQPEEHSLHNMYSQFAFTNSQLSEFLKHSNTSDISSRLSKISDVQKVVFVDDPFLLDDKEHNAVSELVMLCLETQILGDINVIQFEISNSFIPLKPMVTENLKEDLKPSNFQLASASCVLSCELSAQEQVKMDFQTPINIVDKIVTPGLENLNNISSSQKYTETISDYRKSSSLKNYLLQESQSFLQEEKQQSCQEKMTGGVPGDSLPEMVTIPDYRKSSSLKNYLLQESQSFLQEEKQQSCQEKMTGGVPGDSLPEMVFENGPCLSQQVVPDTFHVTQEKCIPLINDSQYNDNESIIIPPCNNTQTREMLHEEKMNKRQSLQNGKSDTHYSISSSSSSDANKQIRELRHEQQENALAFENSDVHLENKDDLKMASFIQNYFHFLNHQKVLQLINSVDTLMLCSWTMLISGVKEQSKKREFFQKLQTGQISAAINYIETKEWNTVDLIAALKEVFVVYSSKAVEICMKKLPQITPLDVLYLTKCTGRYPDLFLVFMEQLVDSLSPQHWNSSIKKYFSNKQICWEWINHFLGQKKSLELKCSCGSPRPGSHRYLWKRGKFLEELIETLSPSNKLSELCYKSGYWLGYIHILKKWSLHEQLLSTVLQLGDIELLYQVGILSALSNYPEKWQKLLLLLSQRQTVMGEVLCLTCGNSYSELTPFPSSSTETSTNWKVTITWEKIGKLLVEAFDSSTAIKLLQESKIPVGGLSASFYQACILSHLIEVQQSALAHRMLSRLESYLWSHRPTTISPEAHQILLKERRSETEDESKKQDLCSTVLGQFLEEPDSHWGITTKLKSSCLVCGLPLTAQTSAALRGITVCSCGHTYHKGCLPEAFCIQCLKTPPP
ncbi:LOW QUALITY PROTEIN: WD40 repeat domain-containing protein pink [Tachypleus tridentatus]|uniref:LOW QUALITY PROTEIN: WD40 repeat domain-containing protein pink n=1 Tax=Tachypleus tridentatus TaxID=6853 RepID=UPI003FCF8C5F